MLEESIYPLIEIKSVGIAGLCRKVGYSLDVPMKTDDTGYMVLSSG